MNRIKEFRNKKGLKQSNLEKMLNIYPSAISDWENEFRYPTIMQAIKLAKVLDTTVEELYEVKE